MNGSEERNLPNFSRVIKLFSRSLSWHLAWHHGASREEREGERHREDSIDLIDFIIMRNLLLLE